MMGSASRGMQEGVKVARSEARVDVAIWRDRDYRGLTVTAQWLHLMLSSQPETTAAGTFPFMPARWANRSVGATLEGVLAAAGELESAGLASFDEGLGEGWVRRSSPPRGPKQMRGAMLRAGEIESPKLRARILDWLASGSGQGAPSRDARRIAVTRAAVYERDGFTCRHCETEFAAPEGYDGTYALTKVTPGSTADPGRIVVLELDHVHPESLGGPFELGNLQALCSSCNSRKGARV